jgi:hypothetical protein
LLRPGVLLRPEERLLVLGEGLEVVPQFRGAIGGLLADRLPDLTRDSGRRDPVPKVRRHPADHSTHFMLLWSNVDFSTNQ